MERPSMSNNKNPLLENFNQQSFLQNESNMMFWKQYLTSLKDLDFSVYSDKLKVPVLVPIGSRILFRGEIKHTNEVIAAMGADYYVKCSLKQAEVLRQYRIKDAESKLNHFESWKAHFLRTKLQLQENNILAKTGEEIMEPFNEHEDKEWRKIHRENVRKYKQNKTAAAEEIKLEKTDDELWERLEELELKEELENEFSKMENNHSKRLTRKITNCTKNEVDSEVISRENNDLKLDTQNEGNRTDVQTDSQNTEHILQKVIEKQNELEQQINELKNKDKVSSKTEEQLLSRLEELEKIDDLEDEIERLDDVLYIEAEDKQDTPKLTRNVSFADEDDTETLEITFSHSENNPDATPYNHTIGISKPSDIYNAFQHLFKDETTSILKKTNYTPELFINNDSSCHDADEENPEISDTLVKTIEIKDVLENVDVSKTVAEKPVRPPSLFKLKRQKQRK